MFSGRVMVKIRTTRTRVQTAPKRKTQQRRKQSVVTTTTTTTSRRPRRVPRNIPAAYGNASGRNGFRVSQRGTSMIVSGRCLLSANFGETVATRGKVFWTYPVNPAYWTGTTISKLAAAYNNYKPLRLRVKYEPTASTAVSGLVVFGTIWQQVAPDENGLVNVLKDSNGGFSTQAFRPYSRNINLRSLTQNMYYVSGDLSDPERNPFQMICTFSDNNASPGQVSIEYSFKFDNPGVVATYSYRGAYNYGVHDGTGVTANYYLVDGTGQKVNGNSVSFIPNVPITTANRTYGAGTVFDYDPNNATIAYQGDLITIQSLGAAYLSGYIATYKL